MTCLGSPPEWTNRALPYNVQPDMGVHFIDQNSHKIPSANLLPLIVAVNQKQKDEGTPPFPWSSVDFVTDRNGLRKLMRWIIGGEVKEFRIDVELAGKKTILFNRWEKRTQERFNGRTYGFQFEKASTKNALGCEEGSGHHRINSYVRLFYFELYMLRQAIQDFNGLKMVVRYEVDACMPQSRRRLSTKNEATTLDSLADAMSNIKLTSTTAPFSSSTMPTLNIINAGTYVPQASIIELTTVAEFRRDNFSWQEAYPQLFFSQTAHHFLAVHYRGRFTSVEKRKLSSQTDFQTVQEQMKPTFKKLRKTLEVIQRLIIEHGSRKKLTLVCSEGQLAVYERRSPASCLPDEAMSCFDQPKRQ